MTLFVCTVCCDEEGEEQQGCTFTKPKTREAHTIYCTPDQYGRIRVPEWREVPEKTFAKIT